jgi:hypothetical protein
MEYEQPFVEIEEKLRIKALKSIVRMLDISNDSSKKE